MPILAHNNSLGHFTDVKELEDPHVNLRSYYFDKFFHLCSLMVKQKVHNTWTKNTVCSSASRSLKDSNHNS